MVGSVVLKCLRKVVIHEVDGCWEWTGRTSRNGYGRVYYDGAERAVHRVLYELLVGPIPEGHQLDHICRNRACVRPEHMEPVTAQENTHRAYEGDLTRDSMGRYRRRKATVVCGPKGRRFSMEEATVKQAPEGPEASNIHLAKKRGSAQAPEGPGETAACEGGTR